MATKRMFSAKIVDSDAFLDMPQTSQLLYFHLAMRVDDDGFVGNPKKIMRMIGSAENDLSVLLGKKFVIGFESGIIVIKHHRMNNNWDSHNCKRTQYLDEFSQLHIKENGAYTLDKKEGLNIQSEYSLISDGKQSLEENRIDKNRKRDSSLNFLKEISKEEMQEFTLKFKCEDANVKTKANALYDYCKAKGRVYKNYKSFLSNALRKDFGERPPKEKVPVYEVEEGKAVFKGYK